MSPRKSHKLLKGPALSEILRVTVHQVKWFVAGQPTLLIPPSTALALVREGEYEGKASAQRVYYIREIDNCPKPVCNPSYWDDRAVYPGETDSPSRHTVDLWDQILKRRSSRVAVQVVAAHASGVD